MIADVPPAIVETVAMPVVDERISFENKVEKVQEVIRKDRENEELKAKQAAEAQLDIAIERTRPAPEPIRRPDPVVRPAPVQPRTVVRATGGLNGSYGYARWGGNCVNEPGVNNPGWGNPINWPATSQNPWIGATVLFGYNHTGVVTGIWDNGDIEIRHQNFKGNTTRFPRSSFRGFR